MNLKPASIVEFGAATPVVASIVILTFSRDPVVSDVLEQLAAKLAGRADYEVILIDNNADDVDRGAWLAPFHAARWLRMGRNVGVIARNAGMAAARGEFLFLLDDDVYVSTPDFLDQTAQLMRAQPEVGVLTIRKVLHDTGDTRVDLIPHTRKDLDMTKPFMTFRFVGGLVIFRRAAFEQVGGFSEDFFYGLEEIEYSYRLINAGWLIRYSPEIVAVELEHPAGRRPVREVQTLRLTNKYIMSYIHMPFPQVLLNYLFFTPYIWFRAKGEIDVPDAVKGFWRWLRQGGVRKRGPISRAAVTYIRDCGGSTWR